MKEVSTGFKTLKGSSVWSELNIYFKKVFDDLPEDSKDSFTVTRDQLVKNLKKYFKNKYDPEEIANLLKNGFEVKADTYLFKLKDFAPVKPGFYDIKI